MSFCKVDCCLRLVTLMVMVGIVASVRDNHGLPCHPSQGFRDMGYICEKYISTEYGKALVPPSKECCAAVKAADMDCFCWALKAAGDVLELISPQKVVYVSKHCGKPRPHGSKCGSYTVPPV